jgi:hypothetical protein
MNKIGVLWRDKKMDTKGAKDHKGHRAIKLDVNVNFANFLSNYYSKSFTKCVS